LGKARAVPADDPLVTAVGGVISIEAIEANATMRAVNVLLTVSAFLGALPP
jgi:hypothetical protein